MTQTSAAGSAKDAADQNFDYMFKLLIIGNSSVGKTSFLFRYADDSFTSAFVSTVGIDFKVKTVFRHDKRVKLQIWDTAGQERYRTITTAYYRGAMGFILMYDITNEESFNAVQDWCTQIKMYSWDNAQVVLVGNKCDLEQDRAVTEERGKRLADQLGLEFFETSAKENINVKSVFERLVDIILEKMSDASDESTATGQANNVYGNQPGAYNKGTARLTTMNTSEFEKNPLSNIILRSTYVPSENDVDKTFFLGIDEAGRGPVLGPMVYSAFFCDEKQLSILNDLGCADSKQLTEERRSSIFAEYEKHNNHLGFILKVLSPHMISTSMLRRDKYNLNDISHDAALELIQLALDQGINVKQVFVDTVGDPDKYANKIRARYPKIKVTVSKKADSLYPTVSASSICAKVVRDQIVQNWKIDEFDEEKQSIKYGSGYPGDPQTKRFLIESIDQIFGFPKFVRFSWSTASTIIENKCIKVTWDDDEDENATSKNTTKKRKSEVIETTTTTTTKTLFNYFSQKPSTRNDAANRRVPGSHFFRAAHVKPAVFST
ncbi:unnamed protein product [Rotaria magnacalcarata]|uniref:Ribonuclease n=2 Tax=Rotaria magnacalcarata TaxID=392030 RepID=A0A819FWV1_9BILA|nr:unnamed protein product [Rotaria magnacalcarata]